MNDAELIAHAASNLRNASNSPVVQNETSVPLWLIAISWVNLRRHGIFLCGIVFCLGIANRKAFHRQHFYEITLFSICYFTPSCWHGLCNEIDWFRTTEPYRGDFNEM